MLGVLERGPFRGRRDVLAHEDAAVPVSLDSTRLGTPPLEVEVELFGRLEPSPVVVDLDPARLEGLEPVRSSRAAGEARPTTGSRRFGVRLEPYVRPDGPATGIEPD